jgi:hypothetical protein
MQKNVTCTIWVHQVIGHAGAGRAPVVTLHSLKDDPIDFEVCQTKLNREHSALRQLPDPVIKRRFIHRPDLEIR